MLAPYPGQPTPAGASRQLVAVLRSRQRSDPHQGAAPRGRPSSNSWAASSSHCGATSIGPPARSARSTWPRRCWWGCWAGVLAAAGFSGSAANPSRHDLRTGGDRRRGWARPPVRGEATMLFDEVHHGYTLGERVGAPLWGTVPKAATNATRAWEPPVEPVGSGAVPVAASQPPDRRGRDFWSAPQPFRVAPALDATVWLDHQTRFISALRSRSSTRALPCHWAW